MSVGAATRGRGRLIAGLLLMTLPGALGAAEPWGEARLDGLSVLPVWGLYSASLGQEAYVPRRPRLNFDISAGPFIPFEGGEDFSVGGTVDFKFQGEVVRNFFLGVEFAFAGHDKGAGELLSEGGVDRFFFFVPVELDIPLGGWEENPFSLRLGLAPGLQVADPFVDPDLQDQLFFSGLHLEENAMVAFDIRARIGLRMPIDPHFGFLVEVAYDWAEGHGKARLEDLFGNTVDVAKRHVSLSALSVFFGFQFVF